MGQIADPRVQLHRRLPRKSRFTYLKLNMSGRELGELEKHWKAVEREAGQGTGERRDAAQFKGRCNALYTGTWFILSSEEAGCSMAGGAT